MWKSTEVDGLWQSMASAQTSIVKKNVFSPALLFLNDDKGLDPSVYMLPIVATQWKKPISQYVSGIYHS